MDAICAINSASERAAECLQFRSTFSMYASVPKFVFNPVDLTLIGRLYLECCTSASAARNAPIESAAKTLIARSLIRSFERYKDDPEMMKQLALRESSLTA
jgi:hypothetical protein